MIEGKGNPLLELQSFGRHAPFSESDTETLQNSPNSPVRRPHLDISTTKSAPVAESKRNLSE